MRRASSRWTWLALVLPLVCGNTGCEAPAPPPPDAETHTEVESPQERTSSLAVNVQPAGSDAPEADSAARFLDRASELGIDFVYDRGAVGKALMTEATGGGVAWIDYDLDGDCDLFLVQGGNPLDERSSPSDQLHRNRDGAALTPVPPAHTFTHEGRYGQGVAVGDFDGDGFPDLYVTNIGRNALLRNQGDGTFEEVTLEAGVPGRYLWSTSAAWADLNRDGLLDLFVCNYLDFDPRHPTLCFDKQGNPSTCDPQEIDAVPNDCYLNLGDGRFEEISQARGLVGEGSKSLGVVAADFNDDGELDLFVANDTTSNFLYLNRGEARFEERAILSGCAMSAAGQNQASMGVAFGDYDRDGRFDLYVTHFKDDSNTLYRGLGDGLFQDITRRMQLHQPTLPYLGFGTVMMDFDQDGRDELFVANGHIDDWRYKGDTWKMPAQLFTYDGRRWRETSSEGGEYFQQPRLGRGVAVGDFNGNGAPDLAVANQEDRVALLENVSPRGHWLTLTFRGDRSNREGIGVRVRVEQSGASLVQALAGGTSYCAGHQPVLFFGLGASDLPCRIFVTWPSGTEQVFEEVAIDRRLRIDERDGLAALPSFAMRESHE